MFEVGDKVQLTGEVVSAEMNLINYEWELGIKLKQNGQEEYILVWERFAEPVNENHDKARESAPLVIRYGSISAEIKEDGGKTVVDISRPSDRR